MRKSISKTLALIVLLSSYLCADAQIEDIKKNSKENKNNKQSGTSFSSDDSSDDLGVGCIADAFSCCFNTGASMFFSLMVENHRSIINLLEKDPTVLSFEARANVAVGLQYSKHENYTYVNFLPGVRGNLGAFSTDFRFNILTEYADDFPDSFSSWEWLFLLNIEPVETFRLNFGSGVQYEKYSASYFNEHYIGFKFGLNKNKDYLDIDTRFSMDYATSAFPFFEAGVHYKKRIAAFDNVFMHISLGGMYQNYYQSQDIWALQGGLIVNVH
ncbi:MAG: hypothetical protein B6I20_07620 [Bacteroidetes bacterium 4572_117]|nr:MAG: hypothetical protein B6I20_07620 [Bacteroidetes bacterium 4572_117]